MSITRDFFGRHIGRGDVFTYAMRMANSSEIGVGIVVQPGSDREPVSAWMLKNTWGHKPEMNKRISKIGGGSNMVIVQPDSIPAEFLQLLEAKL
jgi:hypothetical protein